MIKKVSVHAFSGKARSFIQQALLIDGERALGLLPAAMVPAQNDSDKLYLSPGFIDSHAHVYHGATDLGIHADRIGLKTGVHLIIDAGSAGAINYPCFRDYVMPAYRTPVKAFLNISRIGLVTKQPYHDIRTLDVDAATAMLDEDKGKYLLGIKVLSSGLIVEDKGMIPMRAALEAAGKTGSRIMAHLAEGPPSNEEMIPLLRKGDIITHCFHGRPNIAATKRASRGHAIDERYYCLDNLMWNSDGTPIGQVSDAISRGVLLDVGHGAGSFSSSVAAPVIAKGFREFSISTDAHIRNIDTIVHSLSYTMSKFLALGMSLEEVVSSVTVIPSIQMGIIGWCDNMLENGTLFKLKAVCQDVPEFLDSEGYRINVSHVIEPVAILRNARIERISGNVFDI